jgi:hypothetical protein
MVTSDTMPSVEEFAKTIGVDEDLVNRAISAVKLAQASQLPEDIDARLARWRTPEYNYSQAISPEKCREMHESYLHNKEHGKVMVAKYTGDYKRDMAKWREEHDLKDCNT